MATKFYEFDGNTLATIAQPTGYSATGLGNNTSGWPSSTNNYRAYTDNSLPDLGHYNSYVLVFIHKTAGDLWVLVKLPGSIAYIHCADSFLFAQLLARYILPLGEISPGN